MIIFSELNISKIISNISGCSLKSSMKSRCHALDFSWKSGPYDVLLRTSDARGSALDSGDLVSLLFFMELIWPGREVSWHPATRWNWLCQAVVIRSPGQHKCGVQLPVWSYFVPPHWGGDQRCWESTISFSLPILPFCQTASHWSVLDKWVRRARNWQTAWTRHEYPILWWYDPDGVFMICRYG